VNRSKVKNQEAFRGSQTEVKPYKVGMHHLAEFLKGKSAIQIEWVYLGKRKNFTGQHFWVRGYFVSTVGIDEQAIRKYIRAQEREDRRLD